MTGLAASEAHLLLHQAAHAVRQRVEQAVLRPEALSWTGFVVLRTIWGAGKIETRHAAAHAGISKATLTGVVNTLVNRGLVHRGSHPADRRLVLLSLTGRGQRLLLDLLPRSADQEASALSCLDDTEMAHVIGALRTLIDHLR